MNTRFIKMDITQDDIDSCDDESEGCPVVKAYKRAGFVVTIVRDLVRFTTMDVRMSFLISQFLDNFTRGRYVEPATYTVEVPDG